ncbi:MAG: RNA polymerase sigma-70 factor [Carboxylicivirga sp.]|jgi:RNA polymerase sigma-70 factor (ECF subfamily)|nr:RNA polymerase sigma-70 factor [Carboxylicivirga sp.]
MLEAISHINEQNFDQLFRQYFPRLDAYARRFVKDADVAKDIVQESFINIWEKKGEVRMETLENYLFICVRNSCLNFLKKQLLLQEKLNHFQDSMWMEEIYRIDFLKDEPTKMIEEELREEIHSLMEELPPRCKEVFTLSREEGLKNREIAERLNISIKNVERHISTALKKFKQKFGGEIGVLIFYYLYYSLL